jgi:hypothetical protein
MAAAADTIRDVTTGLVPNLGHDELKPESAVQCGLNSEILSGAEVESR